MKTLKLTTVISLALILFGINSIYAGQKGNNEGVNIAPLIRYHVTIHQPYEGRMCNIYIVRITDVYGNNVTPPQGYSPQVSVYTFYEAGPVKGIRVARLEIIPIG